MTQIRVHELASELNVSTQQVLSVLEEFGQKVRGPSTVIGVSAAAKVRGRLRSLRAGADRPRDSADGERRQVAGDTPAERAATDQQPAMPPSGESLFLPPVAPRAAAVFQQSDTAFANPFAVPGPDAPAVGTPAAVPSVSKPPRTVANRAASIPPQRSASIPPQRSASIPPQRSAPSSEPDHDAAWVARGFDSDEREAWCGAGLRVNEAHLADRCRSMGIPAEELGRKLSGRTVLQRLRDGESVTSVWARIQEAEQQPRRAGSKLTGRFQLS